MSLEAIKPEAVLAACVAIGGVIWKVISMIFGMQKRIEIAERELADLKKEVSSQYQAVRHDIRESAAEAKQRHAHLEEKIDRLIERNLSR